MKGKQMKPLVSVVVPVYNAEKYLSECMDSIAGQSYRNLEIVCVDDGSNDHSRDMICAYMKRDSRIKLLEQERRFAGAARNRGLEASKGKYIIFLDADDFFDAQMIEKMVGRAEDTDADIVICDSQGFDEKKGKLCPLKGALNKAVIPSEDFFSWKEIPDYIFQLTSGWPWDKLYCRNFIQKKRLYFQDTRVANDELFVDLAFAEARRIAVIDEILVTHRTNVPNSIENTRHRWWRCGFEMLSGEHKALKTRKLFRQTEKSFLNRAADYIVWNLYDMSGTSYFHEYYQYAKSEGIPQLGLPGYSDKLYYNEIVYENIQKVMRLTEEEYLVRHIAELNACADNLSRLIERKRWYFPEEIFPQGAGLVIYGYGEIGRDFCHQILNSKNIHLVAAADRNYKKITEEAVKVKLPEEICQLEFDFIFIAVLEKNTAGEIREELVCKGIAPDKIVWYDVNTGNTN